MQPVFGLLLRAYRSVCEGDEGLYAIKTLLVCHGGFVSTDTATLISSSTDIWMAFHPIY